MNVHQFIKSTNFQYPNKGQWKSLYYAKSFKHEIKEAHVTFSRLEYMHKVMKVYSRAQLSDAIPPSPRYDDQYCTSIVQQTVI